MAYGNYFDQGNRYPKRHLTLTPSDTVDFVEGPMLIYPGSAGAISAVDQYGVTVVYTATAGQILPVIVKRVNATGTVASPIIGLL